MNGPTDSESAELTPEPTATAEPTEAGEPDRLAVDDEGAAVRQVQDRLVELGYWLGTPDGVLGHDTHHAVVALQKAAGLSRDGIVGYRHASLGTLYRPLYCNGGIAIHGYPSVPPSPASHSCVRVTNPAMDWMWANHFPDWEPPCGSTDHDRRSEMACNCARSATAGRSCRCGALAP